jgi:hypothetical protein
MNTIHSSGYPIARLALTGQDILMATAFIVVAIVLGLLPGLVIGAMIAA